MKIMDAPAIVSTEGASPTRLRQIIARANVMSTKCVGVLSWIVKGTGKPTRVASRKFTDTMPIAMPTAMLTHCKLDSGSAGSLALACCVSSEQNTRNVRYMRP